MKPVRTSGIPWQLLEPQQCSASLCETVAHEGNVEAVPGSANKAAALTWFRGDPNLRAAGSIHSAPGKKLLSSGRVPLSDTTAKAFICRQL